MSITALILAADRAAWVPQGPHRPRGTDVSHPHRELRADRRRGQRGRRGRSAGRRQDQDQDARGCGHDLESQSVASSMIFPRCRWASPTCRTRRWHDLAGGPADGQAGDGAPDPRRTAGQNHRPALQQQGRAPGTHPAAVLRRSRACRATRRSRTSSTGTRRTSSTSTSTTRAASRTTTCPATSPSRPRSSFASRTFHRGR